MRIWRRLFDREKRDKTTHRPSEHPIPAHAQMENPLDIGQRSDIGKTRRANEDSYLTLKSVIGIEPEPIPVGILIVADGMGGHEKGKEASALATRVASGVIVREALLPLLTSLSSDFASRPVHEILTEATAAASQAVSDMASDAGTTLTSALVVGHSVYVAHVGDTRVYYLDGSGLHQITQDHSLVNRLVELGQISAREAQEHPQRNFLYRAIGQGNDLKVDTHFQHLAADSYLILCSDGLWNSVSEEEMVQTIRSSDSPQVACNRLIDMANEHGGSDNITLVLARINY